MWGNEQKAVDFITDVMSLKPMVTDGRFESHGWAQGSTKKKPNCSCAFHVTTVIMHLLPQDSYWCNPRASNRLLHIKRGMWGVRLLFTIFTNTCHWEDRLCKLLKHKPVCVCISCLSTAAILQLNRQSVCLLCLLSICELCGWPKMAPLEKWEILSPQRYRMH